MRYGKEGTTNMLAKEFVLVLPWWVVLLAAAIVLAAIAVVVFLAIRLSKR